MKPIFRVVSGAVVLALANGVTHTAKAQSAPPPGTPSYPYNADVLLKQVEQQRLTDVENTALIADYMPVSYFESQPTEALIVSQEGH